MGILYISSHVHLFCIESKPARSLAQSVCRTATSNVPLHSGRKPEGPDSLPPRDKTVDTVRVPYWAPQ
jgi:hypothetical protein